MGSAASVADNIPEYPPLGREHEDAPSVGPGKLGGALAVLGLGGLFLVGLLPRLWGIGQRSFWLDELTSLGTAAVDLPKFLTALSLEANGTVYLWALYAWLRIVGFGADEGTIRLLSALMGAAAVPLVYLLGRRLHSPAAGLAAALLLALNGFHLLMSQEARGYAALSSLSVASYLALDRAVERGRRRDWALHGLVTAGAFYSHFFTAFTILAQGLFVLSRRSGAALRGLVLSGFVMLLLTAQLVPHFLQQSHGAKLSHLRPPGWSDVADFLVGFAGGSEPLLALTLALALLGLARGGAVGRGDGYGRWMLLSWFCLPVGLALALSAYRPIFNDRYLLGVLPALPLLAGVGLVRLPRPAAAATLVAFAGLSYAALNADFRVRRNEEFRQAVAYVTQQARPDDGWIFVSKWAQNAFEYYADWHWGRNPAAPYAHIFEPLDWDEAIRVPKYRGVQRLADLEPFAAGHPRIWLILSHEFDSVYDGDMGEPVRNWLTRRGYAASQRQYRSVRVILYQRRSGAG